MKGARGREGRDGDGKCGTRLRWRPPPRAATDTHPKLCSSRSAFTLRRAAGYANDTEGEAAGGAGPPLSSASLLSVASTSAGSFT